MSENQSSETHEAWITGIGLASSLGEGEDANWAALQAQRVNLDATSFAPYIIHPMAPLNYDAQIPKKGDQRQMEPWQRIGTYCAGLALDSAGVKGDNDILGRMDMIVAAGGGERDLATDSAILSGLVKGDTAPGFINEQLMSNLRPTLFLAQLSNLLAGNISIVHGVTGSSRTFMGEEESGVDAVRIALARINSGQSDIVLVGAALNAERKEMLMLYEFGGFSLKDTFAPVFARGDKGGFAMGSAGAFLVIESARHAKARGAKPFARLARVEAGYARRTAGDADAGIVASLEALWRKAGITAPSAIISGASGAAPATAQERAFLDGHRGIPMRASANAFGHTVEAAFPLNIALAAMCLQRGQLFAPQENGGSEVENAAAPTQIVVTSVGHWRGEGLACVEKLN